MTEEEILARGRREGANAVLEAIWKLDWFPYGTEQADVPFSPARVLLEGINYAFVAAVEEAERQGGGLKDIV